MANHSSGFLLEEVINFVKLNVDKNLNASQSGKGSKVTAD